jgi:glutamate racemase
MRIGVFDSGIGGEAVAQHLKRAFPDAAITCVNDREHVPYGNRTGDDVRRLTDIAIQPLLGSDVIVIACNTATALAIEWLRETYPTQLFIGLEPMLKPAAHATKTGVITVCATPATLASNRYLSLKATFAADITVLEPDCSDWAHMIEHKEINEQRIIDTIQESNEHQADVIVLACTHYHWIREQIKRTAGATVTVLDPSDAIARRVAELLGQPQ